MPKDNQQAAHVAVARAIRHRQLLRPSEFQCVDCGLPAKCYDHRDYLKPLNVAPVCRSCNSLRGPAENGPALASLYTPVTARQIEVLSFLIDFFLENDQLPPVDVIRSHFGWSSTNAAHLHLVALSKHGFIEKNAVGKWKFSHVSEFTEPSKEPV